MTIVWEAGEEGEPPLYLITFDVGEGGAGGGLLHGVVTWHVQQPRTGNTRLTTQPPATCMPAHHMHSQSA